MMKLVKNVIATFVCVLFSLSVQAQTRYVDTLFSQIEKKTMEYANKNGEVLLLDAYFPKGDTVKNRAVLLWMHGGGFSGGTRDNGAEVKLMEQAAKQGFVAVSISYRLTRKGEPTGFGCDCPYADKIETFRAASQDVLDAFDFVSNQSSTWNINPNKIIIGGSSAGAEGVLNAIFMQDWVENDRAIQRNFHPAGMLSLAGAMVDVRYLTKEVAIPSVFFHGTDDNLVPYGTAPHHYCKPDKPGYIYLDGASAIIDRLDELNQSYLLHTKVGGKHEMSGIPFSQLPQIFNFFYKTVLKDEPEFLQMKQSK